MNSVSAFLVCAVATASISLGIVLYLKPHLTRLLVDLCGTLERAQFWVAFSNVTLVLFPTIFSMHFRPDLEDSASIVFQVSRQMEWGLAGMLVGVMSLGFVLARFILAEIREQRTSRFLKLAPLENK